MTLPRPSTAKIQEEIGRRVKMVIAREMGPPGSERSATFIVDNRVQITRRGYVEWYVSLLSENNLWIPVFIKAAGTSRPEITNAPYEAQYKTLLILRRHLILDELADV